jgi:hypothetical protein
MKHLTHAATVLLFLAVPAAWTQHQAVDALGKAPAGRPPAPRAASDSSDSGTANSKRIVFAREFVLPPGSTTYFEWLTDLSGAERVAISMTTLSDRTASLSQVRVDVAFASPGDWYIITDVIFGSSFFYSDHGGATVPVYGPLMKLAVSNDGVLPVRLTQLVAYAVLR